jgi:alpha-L-rhamnosidase
MPNPRLSWEINSDIRGLKQKSYHILVASSLEKLNADNDDLWDSERKSDASILVEYNGKPLQGRNDCFWMDKTEHPHPEKRKLVKLT